MLKKSQDKPMTRYVFLFCFLNRDCIPHSLAQCFCPCTAQCFCPCTAAHSQAQTSGFFSINPTLRPASTHGVARAEKKITAGLVERLAISTSICKLFKVLVISLLSSASLLTLVAKLDIFIKDDGVYGDW